LFRAHIQTIVKANLIKNFNLDIEKQFFGHAGSTKLTRVTSSTKSNGATGSIDFIKKIGVIESIKNTWPIEFFWVLENKHTFIWGQLFKIAPNLRQYVDTNLAPRRKIITTKCGCTLLVPIQ
jgi:hypothetical protein